MGSYVFQVIARKVMHNENYWGSLLKSSFAEMLLYLPTISIKPTLKLSSAYWIHVPSRLAANVVDSAMLKLLWWLKIFLEPSPAGSVRASRSSNFSVLLSPELSLRTFGRMEYKDSKHGL